MDSKFIPAVLIVFLLQCCEKEPEPLTTDSSLIGNVFLSNQNNGPYSDVKVIATGPYGTRSALTDGNGRFVFRGLGNGTYYLDYSKQGYGSVRLYNVQLFGGDTVKAADVILYDKPGDFNMPVMERAYVKSEPYGNIIIIETSQESYFDYPIIFYLDSNAEVSWKQNAYSVHATPIMIYTNPPVLSFEIQIYDLPFDSGTKVYAIAYPCNIQEAITSGYVDVYRGMQFLTTLDKTRPSKVVSFTMP